MFSDSFAGIAPSSAPLFIAAQVMGGGLALLLVRALYADITARQAAEVVVPHETVGSRS
jgi:arsenate reductase